MPNDFIHELAEKGRMVSGPLTELIREADIGIDRLEYELDVENETLREETVYVYAESGNKIGSINVLHDSKAMLILDVMNWIDEYLS